MGKKESMFFFYIVALYLFFEYARPQLLLPFLRYIHIPAIAILCMIIYMIFSGKLSLKDKATIVFLLILGEMVIHGPIAENNYWAFWIFYGMAINFVAYLGIAHIINSELKFEKLLKFYLFNFVFLSIVGIVQGGKGVGGFIGDENDFCMALNMALPFALFGILTATSKSGKICYIVLSCLFLLANIITLSRGGFIGLGAVLIYCFFKSKHKIALGSIMALLVIIALLLAPAAYWDEVKSISEEPGNTQGTGAQRIYAWKLGWDMFLDNPILGVGQGNYPWHVVEVENKADVQWQERSLGGRAAHSLYFTLLPELGLIGTILFAALLFYIVKDTMYIKKVANSRSDIFSVEESKKIYYHALTFEASIIGYLVSSVFISTLYYPYFYVLCGFIISLKRILMTKISAADPTQRALATSNGKFRLLQKNI
jgi:O-antigen ligase